MSRSEKSSNPLTAGHPIRLTHCIGTMRLGGAEKQLAELICRLPVDRYRQSLVLIQGGGPLIEKVKAAGCEVIELNYAMKYRAFDPRCYWAMGRALWKFVRHLQRKKPHILHAQLYWANILGVFAGRLARVPIILTSRLQLSDYKKGRPILQWLENFANRRTTAIFANSQAVKRDALEHERVDAEKIHVLYNGVALEQFEQIDPGPQRREFEIREGQPVVVAVANLHPYKGHDDLLYASARLVPYHRDLKVILPGRDQGAEKRLRELIGELSLERHVVLPGERRDIPQLIAMADVVVHPSHQEGFSNSILEGMSAGRPLVVTNVGGNPEAVRDGENGFVVPSCDPEALASAIQKLLKNPDLRLRMGSASRRRIENEFSMTAMVAAFQQWYESLVRRHIP